MTTFLLATRNAHKVGEIRAILGDRFRYLTLADAAGAPVVHEDAPTFAGNATKKAVELAAWLATHLSTLNLTASDKLYVLADDSGLQVDALHGEPGVHSARFAAHELNLKGNSPDAQNNAKLLRLLKEIPREKRTARFRCLIALVEAWPHAHLHHPHLFGGACEGWIDFAPRGAGGFGYDPLFIPAGLDQSFAELGEAEKNRISHRSHALASLKDWLANQRV
ncbi:MAG: non-canonical purine NTP pyrophosphatase [Verrucomicrobia bacterium]|nr:non-canonical purine NTP pyrophosphatase [Verrucomicrobiota bacterium]